MASDVAKEIVKHARDICIHPTLKVSISICCDTKNEVGDLDENKNYIHFRNIAFEVDKKLGIFDFELTKNMSLIYSGFVFIDFDDAFKMLLYQYLLHASYIEDITNCDVIIIEMKSIQNSLSLCYPINLSEIPLNELDTITTDIIEKIIEPMSVVYNAWKKSIEKI
jgi:hypothetical protein